MSVASFPTTFPADAASKIGQAILAKNFTSDLVEPIYDLIGFGLYKLFGSAAPFPNPVPAQEPKMAAAPGESDVEKVGHMLNAACAAHAEDGLKAAPNVSALPWATILSVLFTILQGILLGASPSPIPSPTPPIPATD